MKIGQRVRDQYDEPGTVVQMYDDFSACAKSCVTMTGEEWLRAQVIPFTEEELAEPWFKVKLDAGGSAWSPLSRLTAGGRA